MILFNGYYRFKSCSKGMGRDNLENISGLQSLEAENKHLKSMLNRYVVSNEMVRANSFLLSQIERISNEADDFSSALVSCLECMGVHYSADRVSFFTFDDDISSYVIEQQWANSVAHECSSENLSITLEECPLDSANHGKCFGSTDFDLDISNSLKDKLNVFGIQSILFVPVSFLSYKNAFVLMESCAFKRQWYPFEVKEIEQVVLWMTKHLEVLWHKSRADSLWHLNILRNKILHQIKGNKRTKKSLNQMLKVIGKELGLRSVYFVDKSGFSNEHELSWAYSLTHEEKLLSNADLEKLNLNEEEETGLYLDAGTIEAAGIDVVSGTSFMLFNKVFVQKEYAGWLIGEFGNYIHHDFHILLQLWESIALALSEYMSQVDSEQEHNSRYAQVLDQNRDLIQEQIYLKQVLDDLSLAVLIIENDRIIYVNNSASLLLERDLEEFASLKVHDIVPAESRKIMEEAIGIVKGGRAYKGDMVVCSKSNRQVDVELVGTSLSVNSRLYYYFTIQDISVRKQNEKALKESEREFCTLAQNSPNVILRLNKGGVVEYFNPALMSHFKFLEEEEIVGNTLHEMGVLNGLMWDAWQAKVRDVFDHGEAASLEQDFGDAAQGLYLEWNLSPEKDENGRVISVLAIGRNMTSYKQAEKELVRAKERAEESDKLKSEFLANISHELRTPLNAIVGFSSLIRGNQLPPNEIDEYVDVIHKNSDSLMSLINNIIDVAKIKSGRISVVREEVLLDDLLHSIYNEFVPRIEVEHKGRVKLYYSRPEGLKVKIVTDPIRLRQVLVNLLGNAMKFTIKGFIEFGFSVENVGIRIFVKDTGIGISEAKQKVIFELFEKDMRWMKIGCIGERVLDWPSVKN